MVLKMNDCKIKFYFSKYVYTRIFYNFYNPSHVIIVGLYFRKIRVWDWQKGDCIFILEGHKGKLHTIVSKRSITSNFYTDFERILCFYTWAIAQYLSMFFSPWLSLLR